MSRFVIEEIPFYDGVRYYVTDTKYGWLVKQDNGNWYSRTLQRAEFYLDIWEKAFNKKTADG